MFREVRKRAQKAGQPPGTLVYTGKQINTQPTLSVIIYSPKEYHEKSGATLQACLPEKNINGTTWVNITGLSNIELIQSVGNHYHLHPLTIEDILNVEQRPKVEEFEQYIFVTMKLLFWDFKKRIFSTEQLSLVLGKEFVLTFQERDTGIFKNILDKLHQISTQRLREQGSDFLTYRLMDTVIDQYFIVLEGLGEHIEEVEELIINSPTRQNSRTIYRLKRQMLLLRKAIWPMREAISHLLQANAAFITPFTHVYLRDIYDHTAQAIDNVEIFRDMLSGMLDIYLSSLTNKMNEIMKVLTIIATVFIPLTFITGLFGMNFTTMPPLHWPGAFYWTLGSMGLIAIMMLYYFRRNKWM